jgi:hypothetical protein
MLVLDHSAQSRPEAEFWFTDEIHADAATRPGSVPFDGDCHGRAAWASAVEDGLMADEIRQVLAGRRMTEAFPVRFREAPQAYAARAVAEMMVVYLS